MIEDLELHRLFKAESAEHLARLDDALLRLEKTPADAELLEEAFRESHSLKGASRMLGLAGIEAAAHNLESAFNAARNGEAPLTLDTIEHMNSALNDLRRRVQEALSGESQSFVSVPTIPSIPSTASTAPVTPAPALAEPMHSPVIAEPVADDKQATPASVPAATLSSVHSNHPATLTAVSEPFHIETVRVETRKLDDMLTQVGELSVIQGRAQHRLALMDELQEQWAQLERGRRKRGNDANVQRINGEATGSEAGAALRFCDLLKQARDALFDDSARLESTVHLLEDQVRGIRLLPLSTVFSLFPRMLRDLAREQGKEAELTLEGGDITVDKRILEEMKDPLMHLIRNAIDHGIETPAERERLGKPRSGTVLLRARRDNACILLEVHDDGRGLDPLAISQEARKRGLLDDATLSSMTPVQWQQLVFTPGFSTSSFVTELSGRGVGLDVVRVNVERMKGSISLESAISQGLNVQLRLPLSAVSARLLLARVNEQLYGLPVDSVQTSLRVRATDIFSLEGRQAVLLNGQPVISAHLADLLELPSTKVLYERAEAPAILACIVLQVGDERLGLLVDELVAEEEVVPKPLGAPLKRVRNVSALSMLGSGDICVVLNPADLLLSAQQIMRGAESAGQGEKIKADKSCVLLVEDSALIRAMEKRILEDGGYEVVATVDGVDALNALGSRSFAAVVSDVMMPNMNGLDLTAHIRAELRYKDLPVILVTTLASDDDKRRGLDAGANAYIPKPSFDQRVLLETLKRLIVK